MELGLRVGSSLTTKEGKSLDKEDTDIMGEQGNYQVPLGPV
jgi:hypothetical protein